MLSKLPILDLWMKGGALGVALVLSYFLHEFVNKQYADNKEMQNTLVAIVREQNGGLSASAASQRDMTRAIENNNRLIETILYERRISAPRTGPATLGRAEILRENE